MSIKIVKNYVNGLWREGENTGYIDVENPSTGEILAKTPLSSQAEVNQAIGAAYEAYKSWKNLPVARRVQPLYELVDLLRQNEERISRLLVSVRCCQYDCALSKDSER